MGRPDCECFSSEFGDAFVNRESSYTPHEAEALIEGRRSHNNLLGPHSSFGCQPVHP